MKTKKAVIYTRVSDPSQVQNYSLSSQESDIKKFAKQNSIQIVQSFTEEGCSAKNLYRPKLQQLIKYIQKNKVDHIIVWKRDRLTRSVYDLGLLENKFEKKGVTILSATQNNDVDASSKLLKGISACYAEYQSDIKSQRTKRGMMQAVSEGRWVSKLPLGYDFTSDNYGRKIAVQNKLADTLKKLFNDTSSGLYKTSSLFSKYKEIIPNLTMNKMYKILSNKFYAGIIISKCCKNQIKGLHTPIITEKEFYKVQQVIHKSQKTKKCLFDFPLNGFCYVQNKPVSGCWSQGKTKKYKYYKTNKVKFNIPSNVLQKMFIEYIKKIYFSPKIVEIIINTIENFLLKGGNQIYDKEEECKNQIQSLEKKLQKNYDSYINEYIDETNFLKNKKRLEDQLIDLNNKFQKIINKPNFNVQLLKNRKLNEHLAILWHNLEYQKKRALQLILFPNGLNYVNGEFQDRSQANHLISI